MIKYDFPDYEWTKPADCIGYYSWYFEQKFGKKLPNSQWGRYCKQVKLQIKNGHSYENLKYLLWGTFNFKNKVQSLNYSFYFWDKLDEYKKLKKKYDKMQKESENKEEIIYEQVKNKTAEDRMKESQKKLLEEFGIGE